MYILAKLLNNKTIPFILSKSLIDTALYCTSVEAIMSENQVKKPKYNGKVKKRQWEDRRSDKGAGLDPMLSKKIKESTPETETVVEKIKRRKFAVLLGYSGAEYFGMQRNPNMKTIEEEFFSALLGAGFMNDKDFEQVQNVQYQRAARTDKGVSAARQVVSLKMPENFEIGPVNERLSEKIRVFAFKRVTKGFNSKSLCCARTYIYVCPTVAFSGLAEVEQKGYRLDEKRINQINEVMKMFTGTKNFHNFTVKKRPGDPSSKRFIKAFECERIFVKDDVEFCVLKVHGQSFMMHQIRRMVGLVLAVIRGMTTQETIEKAFTDEKVHIPRAPGLGLLLDYVHYDRYNMRYGDDGMHEKLEWTEVEKEVEEFKEQQIYPTILNTEINEEAMVWWIHNKLKRHSYDEIKDGSDDEEDEEDAKDDENESNIVEIKA